MALYKKIYCTTCTCHLLTKLASLLLRASTLRLRHTASVTRTRLLLRASTSFGRFTAWLARLLRCDGRWYCRPVHVNDHCDDHNKYDNKNRQEHGSIYLRGKFLAENCHQQHQRDDLPYRCDRAGKRKQFRHRRIPQILTYKRQNQDRDHKRQQRRNQILVRLLTMRRRSGQIRHTFHSCETQTLKHFYLLVRFFVMNRFLDHHLTMILNILHQIMRLFLWFQVLCNQFLHCFLTHSALTLLFLE